MNQYQVQLGGVYGLETEPGTVGDPTTQPTAVNWLDASYMSIGANGSLNEARCISNKHAEDFFGSISRGQWIQIARGGSGSGGSGSNNVVFDGVVVNLHLDIGGDRENTELVAFDHGSFLLHRITCHGQWRRNHTKEQAFYTGAVSGPTIVLNPGDMILDDQPLVFNPDGQPNRTWDEFETLGTSHETHPPIFMLFEVPFRDQYNSSGQHISSTYWRVSDAVSYLLNVSNASWCIDPASYNSTVLTAVFGTTGNPVISNINCEGKTLAQALTELLTPYNYGYWVDPALNSNNLHNINFYQKGKGYHNQLNLAVRGTNAHVSTANLIHCDLLFDNAGTINRVQAFGDRLTFTTLAHTNPPSSAHPPLPTLVKCWHDADLVFPSILTGETQPNWWDTTFRGNYCNQQLLTPPMGSETAATYGVGRTWVVNLGECPWRNLEDLTLDLIPSGSGSGGGSGSGITTNVTGNNNVDPRRFEKPELYIVNSEGGILAQEEVVVEISTDSGNTWEIVDRSEYRLLPDSMGLVFTSPSLDLLGIDISALDGSGSGAGSGSGFGKGYWQALYDGTLQIRILAAIKSDERLHCQIENDGSAFPLAIGGVYNNSGYKRAIYNDAIDDAIYYINYPPTRVNQDDTAALETLTQTQLANTNRTQISGSATVLFEDYAEYQIGDVITQILNRTIALSTGVDPGPTVVHIVYKFQEQQTTLTLDNHRVATIIRSKAINQAQNRNQHKLGIENPVANTGGHNVPYLPQTTAEGRNSSWEKYIENGGGI